MKSYFYGKSGAHQPLSPHSPVCAQLCEPRTLRAASIAQSENRFSGPFLIWLRKIRIIGLIRRIFATPPDVQRSADLEFERLHNAGWDAYAEGHALTMASMLSDRDRQAWIAGWKEREKMEMILW